MLLFTGKTSFQKNVSGANLSFFIIPVLLSIPSSSSTVRQSVKISRQDISVFPTKIHSFHIALLLAHTFPDYIPDKPVILLRRQYYGSPNQDSGAIQSMAWSLNSSSPNILGTHISSLCSALNLFSLTHSLGFTRHWPTHRWRRPILSDSGGAFSPLQCKHT